MNRLIALINSVLLVLALSIDFRLNAQTSNCTVCNGSGSIVCAYCKGSKYEYIQRFRGGQTRIPCRYCKKTGKLGCIVCRSTGKVVTYSLPPASPSPYYNGEGNNVGSSTSSRVRCSRCGGSGVCKGCGNTGGSWQYVDGYTGSGAKSFINCGECNGRRQCPICYGRGYL